MVNGLRGLLWDAGIRMSIRACGTPWVRSKADADGPALYHDVVMRSRPVADGAAEWIAVDRVIWCGSARCPRCAPHVASKFSGRVAGLLEAVRDTGAGVAFATFTVAHGPDMPLRALREVLGSTWRDLQSGGLWRRLKRGGLIGITRTWEATWGAGTGWHPHAHSLVIHRDGPDAAAAAGRDLVRRWLHLLDAAGWRAAAAGQDVRPVHRGEGLGDYGIKALRGWTVASEMAAGLRKTGRRPGRMSLPELLAVGLAGDAEAAERYVEACEALKGQRLFVVGPSIKKALGMGATADLVDGEALELDEDDGEMVGPFSGRAWVAACDRGLCAWVIQQVKARWRATAWADLRRELESAVLHGPDPPDTG